MGIVDFAVLGPYGTWVPGDKDDSDIIFLEKNPGKAALVIRLDVPNDVYDSLSIIDEAVKSKFEATGKPFTTFYPAAKEDTPMVTIKNKLLFARRDWNIMQLQRQLDRGESKGNYQL